jgi:RHH-type transcriptional regulator, proline utilization regulon repressor / proline dehydrogenase / delta 1-pyrroline-5-carboxylate dehydrogenase
MAGILRLFARPVPERSAMEGLHLNSSRMLSNQFYSSSVESRIRLWGMTIFEATDAAGTPSLLSREGFYGALMEWAMRDPNFKTELFRFIDVLPSLHSSSEVARHLEEYLGDDQVKLSAALRLALKASTRFSWLAGTGVKAQVTGLARRFMLGNDDREIAAALRQLHDRTIGFTVDVLGETVVSEAEADQYARRYLALIDLLAREIETWPRAGKPLEQTEAPLLNLSIKISALYSQIHPADPDAAIDRISRRLRPILRRAKEARALLNFDMEHDALKDLTLRLFKTIFSESEFASEPARGLALQAYHRESEADLLDLLEWARHRGGQISVRLVKGAYWDYETVMARQRGWPAPVFARKVETDANFEKLSLILLQNPELVDAAFGTHNVRSIAHVLAHAERLGVPPHKFEFQMLYGMADATQSTLAKLGFRVREYCPVGELLPGMAYLVRRLLENTSNEGFLARNISKTASQEELLKKPEPKCGGLVVEQCAGRGDGEQSRPAHSSCFHNEPPADFTNPAEREKVRAAIKVIRGKLGRHYPLIIDNRPIQARDWIASLNPANQNEVIGYAAQASLADADAALTSARKARKQWARTPAHDRAAIIERTADLLRRDKAELCALEILEAGKQWIEADADVVEAIDFCRFYSTVMRELARPQQTQRVPGETNVQHWLPRGTGLVIAPWNFPLAILTGMTVAAVVTGNTVLMKPSDQTPIIAARLMALLVEAGLPEGVVNLVTGPGSTVGAHLVAHPEIDFIAFTGSKEVGLKIWETAGRTHPGQDGLKKVICEMGGKNAVIVDNDADLDEAVLGAVVSAFGYQGQKCSALSRLIVMGEIYDRFLSRLIAAAASLRVGFAEEPGATFGPVISREAQQRILRSIQAGRTDASLAWQGESPGDPHACYVPATIFTNVPPTSPLFKEEIFGPVLSVTRARDFEEALALANTSEFALTGGLYSRSPFHIERAKAELACGNLYINRPVTGAIVERQPFGGFKMSGGGTKAGGREYLQNFMVPRVITENCLRRGFAPDESGL